MGWRWWLPPLFVCVPVVLGVLLLSSLPGTDTIYYPIVRAGPRLAIALVVATFAAIMSGGLFPLRRLWFTAATGFVVLSLCCSSSSALLWQLEGPREVDGKTWIIASDGRVFSESETLSEDDPSASAWLYTCGEAGWCTRCKAFYPSYGSSFGAATAFPGAGEPVICDAP